jgi:protein AbiQ
MKFERRVYSNKENERTHTRKYLGTVLEINGFKYFVPLSSPKDSDYFDREKREIRKSTVPIIRMVSQSISGELELKGTLKFSNMIPVPECSLQVYDLNAETDPDYKILVTKELEYINSNSERVIKNAEVIYKQKTQNRIEIGYINNTVDFRLLEEKCKEYIPAEE